MVIFSLLLINSSFAQEARITIRKKGYGENPQEVQFTIHNTGDITLTNFDISVDGKEVKSLKGRIDQRKGFGISLYLEPGEHLIEVKTLEGAYDSETVMVSPVEHKEYDPQDQVISLYGY